MKTTHTTMHPNRKALRIKTIKEFLGGIAVMSLIVATFFFAAVMS